MQTNLNANLAMLVICLSSVSAFGDTKPLSTSPRDEAKRTIASLQADDPKAVAAIEELYHAHRDVDGNITNLSVVLALRKDSRFSVAKPYFAGLRHVQRLEIDCYCKDIIDALGEQKSLGALKLRSARDPDLINFANLPNLRELTMVGCLVTDQLLESTKSLRKLDQLKIARVAAFRSISKKSDEDFAQHLPNVRMIELADVPLCDADIDHFKGFDKLEELRISGSTKTTNQSLVYLSRLPRLKSLTFTSERVKSEDILLLKNTGIKALCISSPSVDDTVFKYLPELQNLKIIDLSQTKVTGAAATAYTNKFKLPSIEGIPPELPDPPSAVAKLEPDDPILVSEIKTNPFASISLDKSGNVNQLTWSDGFGNSAKDSQ